MADGRGYSGTGPRSGFAESGPSARAPARLWLYRRAPPPGALGLVGSGIAEGLGLTDTNGTGSPAMRVISLSHADALSSPPATSGAGAACPCPAECCAPAAVLAPAASADARLDGGKSISM